MSTMNVSIITGGLALHSYSAQLADRFKDAVKAEGSHRGVDVSIRTHHLSQYCYEIADFISNGYPEGELEALLAEVQGADGIITVSPTFQASYSGLFKSFWDLVSTDDLAGTPLMLGATGGSARQSMVLDYAMRPLFTFLHADVVPTGVYATPTDLSAAETLRERVSAAAREFLDRAQARGPR
ncbi:CE1759 family FMN reductase [Kocuria massiliensis]|uniref:CE1759 family FMN reductase n=1 Tax=Kocuria massiliensis TaxID=1926282 RepID=UPI0022B972B0|nr:CE1759 family FMN reductase [Kocuria massiliensis]